MRRIALLLLLLLAACPRALPDGRESIDCAALGHPEAGTIPPVDCAEVAARIPLLEPDDPRVDRPANFDPLQAAAGRRVEAVRTQAETICRRRNRCELGDAAFRDQVEALALEAASLRRLAGDAAPGGAMRRELASILGRGSSTQPAVCPIALLQACADGTCAPAGASCCNDGSHCEGGVCCGTGCCAAGEICGAGDACQPAPRCGGGWPTACPDGSCAPAGASCCGEGRFCRTGSCCGAGGCCAAFEACVAGRCIPGAQSSCSDLQRPLACPDGSCAPIGGSCCGGGRICESGTCCGESCCLSGEVCLSGSCVGPAAPNPACGGTWPVTCADGSCAPSGAACCGDGRFCQAGSSCCGASCCLPGEVCSEGGCVGG